MRVRGGFLSYVVLMLLVPLHCEAQGRSSLLERAAKEVVTAGGSYSSRVDPQLSGPASSGRDSLLNGAAIGFAAGAAFGIAYVHGVRDSDLDAGSYAYGALVFGGIGAAVGLGVDALFNRNASVTKPPRRVALGPIVTRKTAGIHVIKRW